MSTGPNMRLVSNIGVARNRDVAVMRANIIAASIRPSRGGVSTSNGVSQHAAENFKTAPYPRIVKTDPWTISDVSASGEIRVSVYPGFINGEAPLIGSDSILDEPPPYIVLTASCGIYAKVTVDASDDITDYEVIASTSTPSSSYTPGSGGIGYARLAFVTIASGSITSITTTISRNLLVAVGAGYLWSTT